jgi:hypothetical protein
MQQKRLALIGMILFALLPLGRAYAADFGDLVVKTGDIDENVLVGGERIKIDANIDGDVTSAGGTTEFDGIITGDILAVGQKIMVTAEIKGDVRVAGATVVIAGQINGDILAAGMSVTINEAAVVGGEVWVGGGEVVLAGTMEDDVHAGGKDVVLSGTVMGDAIFGGETIRITSTARIMGDFTYHGVSEAIIDPGAEIAGDIVFIRTEQPEQIMGGLFAGLGAFGIAVLVGLIIVGIIQMTVFPRVTRHVGKQITERKLRAFLIGLAMLILTPIAIALSAASVVGLPLAVLLLSISIVTFMSSIMTSISTAGGAIYHRFGGSPNRSWVSRSLVQIVSLIVFFIIQFIPVIGGLTLIAAVSFGMGGFVLAIHGGQARQDAHAT